MAWSAVERAIVTLLQEPAPVKLGGQGLTATCFPVWITVMGVGVATMVRALVSLGSGETSANMALVHTIAPAMVDARSLLGSANVSMDGTARHVVNASVATTALATVFACRMLAFVCATVNSGVLTVRGDVVLTIVPITVPATMGSVYAILPTPAQIAPCEDVQMTARVMECVCVIWTTIVCAILGLVVMTARSLCALGTAVVTARVLLASAIVCRPSRVEIVLLFALTIAATPMVLVSMVVASVPTVVMALTAPLFQVVPTIAQTEASAKSLSAVVMTASSGRTVAWMRNRSTHSTRVLQVLLRPVFLHVNKLMSLARHTGPLVTTIAPQ
eukprot:GILJ01000652.1.p2 GENE.GILJ01000652.1~~GILJ01000652.1.p2  ORF type:complete len:331 (-),score=12.18 GILJ01000652.1:399-1391(-)